MLFRSEALALKIKVYGLLNEPFLLLLEPLLRGQDLNLPGGHLRPLGPKFLREGFQPHLLVSQSVLLLFALTGPRLHLQFVLFLLEPQLLFTVLQ